MAALLGVDLGLRTGLACYGDDGRLRWVRSHNLGSRARLKKAIPGILREIDDLSWVILEGGGDLAEIWAREADRLGMRHRTIPAEVWRSGLLYPRERRTGALAKANADTLARNVVAWSGLRGLTSLRHDAAEAILVGLWGVRKVGWLPEWPAELRR